ncbi:MAG TPA: hypothetical protein ENK76_03295 [Campylobacterales bacterium]|nr:hypothetical protein [Campylobacterales bacterium]
MKPIIIASIMLTMSSCSSEQHKIVSIAEASGISYCQNTDTLMVANDEGSIYEITPKGEIISRHKLGKYDLEGVVCEDDKVIFAVEGGSLLKVNRKSFKIKEIKIDGFKFDKKSGIEGIAKIGNLYYLSIQAKKKKNAKILVVKAGDKYAKIKDIINHGIIDSAGMEYYNKKLYIVSDKKDKLYIYNIKTNTVQKKIKLDKFAQEGITFDNSGNVFLADDDGTVFRYTKKELGIR